MDFRSPADLTMAYGSASSIQPHMPAHHPQQNLVDRAFAPESRRMFTKEKWDTMKPVILKLYLTEHKSFKQVVGILRKEHDFYPTENQFKKKINKWGFKKNFKGHELLAAIEGIKGQVNGQLDVKVGGFQVPDRRIKRVQQKQAKLKAVAQHLISRDYEEMVFEQADDKTTNFSPPLVPIQKIQDVQDAAASCQNQESEMEMDDVIELPTSPADDIDDVMKLLSSGPPEIEYLCETFTYLKIDINLEYWQNPLYENTEIPDRYLTENDLQNIFVPTNALFESPKTTDSSKSTELVIKSSCREPPLVEPLDWSFIKIVLGMGTINTLSPFPTLTPTRMNRTSSSGSRTTEWEQIGFEVAKHKANLCKLVDTFGPENPGALHAMAELAYWYYKRLEYKSAEYLYTKAAHAYEKSRGFTNEKTLLYYIYVARSLYNQKRYPDAERIHSAVHSTIISHFGRTSKLGILSTQVLALILGATNRKSEAEELLRQNLQIRLNMYGPWHKQTLNPMAYLNYYYSHHSLSLECERLSYTILQIQNAALNVAEEERYRELINVAESQYGQGNHKKSISIFEMVAAQQKILLGLEHPDTLNTQRRICSCLRRLGRFVECEELLQYILKEQLQIFGKEHRNVFYTNWELGHTFKDMCCYGKAIPYFQTAVSIGLRLYTCDFISSCIRNLGFCYKEEGRHEEAVELYYQHIERLHKVVGEIQRQVSKLYDLVLEFINKLGKRYEASNNFQDALALYYDHLERLLPNTGKDHKTVIRLCGWIVWNVKKIGRRHKDSENYENALALYYEHLERLLPAIGKDHDKISSLTSRIMGSITHIGNCYKMDCQPLLALELYNNYLDKLLPILGMDHKLIVALRNSIRALEEDFSQLQIADCVMGDVP